MTHHRTRGGKPSMTSQIRTILSDNLNSAGDMIGINPGDYPVTPQNVRVKINDAIKSEGITAETRTINGLVWIKRTDFPGQATLPGMEPLPPSHFDIVRSFRPWPDDPDYAAKESTIEMILEELYR